MPFEKVGIMEQKFTLTLTQTFLTTPEQLFAAWTHPSQLLKWFAPKDYIVTKSSGELCKNGSWQTEMRSPDGTHHHPSGIYKTIHPPTRLRFTHVWQKTSTKHSPETIITLTFTPNFGASSPHTLMSFVQEGFLTQSSLDSHAAGWREAFVKLAALF